MPDSPEPVISVGLAEDAQLLEIVISDGYRIKGREIPPGHYRAYPEGNRITLQHETGGEVAGAEEIECAPEQIEQNTFTLLNVAIGRSFHWERLRNQTFHGSLRLCLFGSGGITAINSLPLEMYLQSVVCSEMGAGCPVEFLKAHCVVSRSWLLAQLENKKNTLNGKEQSAACWTDVCAHRHYDVCADDHCQRYHGIDQINNAVKKALQDTRGEVLMHEGAVCDARFSKCCGGITERFSTAWQDSDPPYLQPVVDGSDRASGQIGPVASESDVRHFIRSLPPVYCNVHDESLLSAVLPDFDQETTAFFRWTVHLSRERLHNLLKQKTGIDFGPVRTLEPIARGPSGRLFRLRVCGDKTCREFGKELEIRRILSDAHLYSSCFVATPDPDGFVLEGAGWGHGVGMCQIGAAVMARQGIPYTGIVSHYFRGAAREKLYA